MSHENLRYDESGELATTNPGSSAAKASKSSQSRKLFSFEYCFDSRNIFVTPAPALRSTSNYAGAGPN